MAEKRRPGFQPGQSGNPAGRKPGSSAVGKLRAAISEHLPEIIEQLVEKARGGDNQAARLLLERVLPPVKAAEDPVRIEIPDGATLAQKGEFIVRAMSRGDITPSQAGTLLSGLGSLAKLIEITDLEARLAALEGEKA